MHRNQNQINIQTRQQAGFTIVELLVVFLILVLLMSAGLVSWNQQKPRRSLNLAQNELVTNLRKVQSYAVSSRNISENNPASYYSLSLSLLNDLQTQYSVNGVGRGSDYEYSVGLEIISLPSTIEVTGLSIYNPGDLIPTPVDCVQVLVSAVYGKMYFHVPTNCDTKDWEEDAQEILRNPIALANMSTGDLEITLGNIDAGLSKIVRVNGLGARVDAL
ncbi:MAG TPA: prepilin-type N-terminal cleavage/methylation domain-containing protein [Candidatus Doudnabacteria bacterium]|nr:prepilin-type N-terminal cleavage/methylation domain-containing protein [Candidatus Doudnabacteria bacterium]